MLMAGHSVQLRALDAGIHELVFSGDQSVNTLNQATLTELNEAITALDAEPGVTGLLVRSDKESFIVGADVTEFLPAFAAGEAAIRKLTSATQGLFNAIEDLPFPTVAAINGAALGGGLELALSCDYRVGESSAKIGFPEVKLGIFPGWGGTVRLPRLIGLDNAIEWICGAQQYSAADALAVGVLDTLVEPELLNEAAIALLEECISGRFDFRARRTEKLQSIKLSALEQTLAFESAKGLIGAKAGPHYPAPLAALKTIQKQASLSRDAALEVETAELPKVATHPTTAALIGLFLKEQGVKKITRHYEKNAPPVSRAAVIGAGIMGGGIAYQSATRGTRVLMKDINEEALQLGLDEATKLLNQQLERGKIDSLTLSKALNNIRATLSFGDFNTVDLAVEAVVENPKVKKSVLAEVEEQLPEGAILASNTSTISITDLAGALKHPENFCGMHFFNPVHRMPLVEVIRGKQSSDRAIAQTVAYAKALGKTPIVVNDCPGFLVNRILFPYFIGFSSLLNDGADYRQIDRVMEAFGWPMGPAYLLDVIGIDTACHADAVLAAGYPDRMAHNGESAIERLFKLGRLGQKSGQGFYRYEPDRKGKPKKLVDDELPALLADLTGTPREFSDEEIIARMMLPLCIETVRCLEEGIVGSPAEAEMALIYGIGFPPFRGGALYYLDQQGLDNVCRQAERFNDLGKLYQPTEKMLEMAKAGKTYFGREDKA